MNVLAITEVGRICREARAARLRAGARRVDLEVVRWGVGLRVEIPRPSGEQVETDEARNSEIEWAW